jgi:hypothetical protein
VGQAIFQDSGREPGQGQVPSGNEIPHRPLMGVDAGEGQGQEGKSNREDRPEEQLDLETAQPSGHRNPPHSTTSHPRRMASVTASVRLLTPNFP